MEHGAPRAYTRPTINRYYFFVEVLLNASAASQCGITGENVRKSQRKADKRENMDVTAQETYTTSQPVSQSFQEGFFWQIP